MSRSSGPSFSQRLITQMYFEGDPLIPLCPIVKTIPDPEAVTAADRAPGHQCGHADGLPGLQVRHRAARAAVHAVREPAGGELTWCRR